MKRNIFMIASILLLSLTGFMLSACGGESEIPDTPTPQKDLWQNYQNYLGKTTSQIRSALGNPLLDEENMLFYMNAEDNVKSLGFSYNSSRTCYAIGVIHNDNLTEKEVKAFLGSKFYISEKESSSTRSVYYDARDSNNITMVVVYNPEQRSVTYLSRSISRNAPEAKDVEIAVHSAAKRFLAK